MLAIPPWSASRRLYILPTRAGLVFAVLLLGLLTGAINYSLSLAYLFTFWFAGVGVVAMLHTHRNLSGLTLNAEPAPPVFAGEEAVFALRAENPHRAARRGIGLRHERGRNTPGDIEGGGSARLELRLTPPRRGWHTPGRVAVYTTWPLGLFRCWTVLEPDWGVLVYPAPAAQPQPLPAHDGGEGETAAATRREGADFTGLRHYRPGDPPRRIAWKSLARGGENLLTKEFAGGAAQKIWLNWQQTPGRDPEARLSRLTRWVLDAHAAGLAYGLVLPGRRLPPQTGAAHLRQCLEALARHG